MSTAALCSQCIRPEASWWLHELGAAVGTGGPAADFYLAGSAALALHLGHRNVAHLDFMSGVGRLAPSDRRDLLVWLLELDPGLRVETARDGYLFVRAGNGTGLQFFWYPYPQIDPPEELGGVEVASLADLGLMKLGAVISRATERDLADLAAICERVPLSDLLARAPEKFGHVGDFALQALKALADLEPLAEGDGAAASELTAWARAQARDLGRAQLGLPASDGSR